MSLAIEECPPLGSSVAVPRASEGVDRFNPLRIHRHFVQLTASTPQQAIERMISWRPAPVT
jgi:hypothetical protein